MTEPWGSVDDVAAHLGVRKDSIYRWIEHRGLPAKKLGKLWNLKLSEVDAWVRARGAGDESPGTVSSSNRAGRLPRDGSPQRRSVLVIDDDESVRETLGDFLSDRDFGQSASLRSDHSNHVNQSIETIHNNYCQID